MRKYLATLHRRPDHHKKRFALLASGGFTLIIFATWSLVTFGNDNPPEETVTRAHEEVGPLESLRANSAQTLEAIKESIEDLKTYGQ